MSVARLLPERIGIYRNGSLVAPFLGALAIILRVMTARSLDFDGLYGQDAYAYYDYARSLLDALAAGHMPPPFWWSLGYPSLLAVGFLVGGVTAQTAQLVTLVAGALVVPLAYLLASESVEKNRAEMAGWAAALTAAASGQLAQSSIVVMADAPALMWAALAGWLMLRYRRTPLTVTLGFSTLTAALAVWTRWQNLIFAAAWFACLVSIERRAGWRRGGRPILVALIVFSLVLLPQLWMTRWTGGSLAGQTWLEGWSPVNAVTSSFDTVDGHLNYALPVSVFYAQTFLHPAYIVFLLTPLFVFGSWLCLCRLHDDPGPAVLLVGWCGLMFIFLAGIPYENFRFGLGMLAPLAALTGIGAAGVWMRLPAFKWRAAFAAYLALALVVMFAWQPRVIAPVLGIKARELEQAQWLQAQLPSDARVWTMGIDGALGEYTAFAVHNIWEKTLDEVVATSPAYLFIDTANLQTQWRGLGPEELYLELLRRGALDPLDSFKGWTLFELDSSR